MIRSKWMLKKAWKAKRQGQVWVVENENGQRGYFKFATAKQWYYSGPMIANEYIALALAKKLGFPAAELVQATVRGPDGKKQTGIVSLEKPAKEIITWREAGEELHSQPERFVEQIDKLRTLVVFDAWIANIDRALGKNLILFRNDAKEKYKWYLIDHGHTLYGSPRKWKRGKMGARIWLQLWKYYHVPKGLQRLQSSWPILYEEIKKIESITPCEIDEALNSVPPGSLRKKERAFIKRLLFYRQKRLRTIIRRWLAYKGTKEYGSDK
ncbi:HipA family kinase [Aneurinibacillus terranovensis]|uniref:HipA family kinase n=1 Tax=Aneurinibacillus terranovensis TaxID=278991 RepID=UPI000416661A|nr:HipA family kinase [Aneurinibacillus terranovensis]